MNENITDLTDQDVDLSEGIEEDELECFIDEIKETLYRLEETRNIQTFEEAGVLTTDKGIVLQTYDYSEFQITIVKSR